MRPLIRRSPFPLVAFLVTLFAGASDASGVTIQTMLDTLLPGGVNAGGLTVGDARVSGFTFESSGPVVVRPQDVTVRVTNEPLLQGGVNVAFAYSPDLPAAAGPASTVAVGYRLDLNPSSGVVTRAGLRFNAFVPSQGPGNSAATVTQTLTHPHGTDLSPGGPVRPTEIIDVFNDGPGRLPDDNTEFLILLPVTSLDVRNDVSLTPRAGTDEGAAAVSFVNTYVFIPEPAAAGLLLCAAAATFLRRRR